MKFTTITKDKINNRPKKFMFGINVNYASSHNHSLTFSYNKLVDLGKYVTLKKDDSEKPQYAFSFSKIQSEDSYKINLISVRYGQVKSKGLLDYIKKTFDIESGKYKAELEKSGDVWIIGELTKK